MMAPALLSAGLLLLLCPGVPAESSDETPISVLVKNMITENSNKNYSTYVVFRGILLGGLTRLQDSGQGFNFNYTEDPNYGPFLKSVNGVYGNDTQRTYWELLVKKPSGKIIRPDVGIGCYIPSVNDQIILNYTKY